MYVFAVVDSQFQPFAEGVYNRSANAVKAACDLVTAAAELTACVEDCENYGRGRDTLFWVDTGRYTASVVGNLYHVAGKNIYVYLCAVTCEGFVDSVVHYLVNKVVQTVRAA